MKKTHIRVDKTWHPACHDNGIFGEDYQDGCAGWLLDGEDFEDDTLLDVCMRCPFRNKMYEEGRR